MRHRGPSTLTRTLVIAILFAVGFIRSAAASDQGRDDDFFAFGRNIVLSRSMSGDVVVIGGSLDLRAPVHGDVVVLGGNLVVLPDVRIDGDVMVMGGRARGLNSYNVGGDVYAPGVSGRPVEERGSMPAAFDRTGPAFMSLGVKLVLLLFWVLFSTVITLFAGREVRGSSLEIRAAPLQVVTLGLVGFTSFVLSAIIFSYLIPYIIGIPLLIVLGFFAVLTKVFGLIAVFHAVGHKLFGPRQHDELLRRRIFRGDVPMVLAGLILLGGIHLIPVIGNLVWMMASVTGIGASLATRFGRREPWFLATRPADA